MRSEGVELEKFKGLQTLFKGYYSRIYAFTINQNKKKTFLQATLFITRSLVTKKL